ncbi:hypothetical protein SEA_MCGALLEON_30 [Microbacterium phage McGalleon]|uniref:Uncharacterized protein n=1 Tax=Microbacterium phage McGalleon TaxID=2590936 RepID=A0A516KQV8_9CAUD|nr:hypothetical protein H3N88_gp30 [Microbacterium phage McGalleon]QDP44082.1 hypothetical protein SEA_MCGALLEON_30 [Microbacterium phage McGalleon]
MAAPKVNFKVRTQAIAYSEGCKDGMALLITALEEGGDINYLLEVLEANARPEDRDRLNRYYDIKRAAGL